MADRRLAELANRRVTKLATDTLPELANRRVAKLATDALPRQSCPLPEWGAKEPLQCELRSQWPTPHARHHARDGVERQVAAEAAQRMADRRLAELANRQVAHKGGRRGGGNRPPPPPPPDPPPTHP